MNRRIKEKRIKGKKEIFLFHLIEGTPFFEHSGGVGNGNKNRVIRKEVFREKRN